MPSGFRALMRSKVFMIYSLAVLVGAAGGVGAIVFKSLIDLVNYLFFVRLLPFVSYEISGLNIGVVLLLAFGAVIVGLIVGQFAAEVRGHGIPQVIESVTFHGGRMRYRVAAAKIITSSITIGSGGSAGREGPIAQIGAGFGSMAGQIMKLTDKDVELLVVCGLSSGIAATFNAPLGGAIFGLELLFRRVEVVEAIPVLLSSVIGTAVSTSFLGNFITFPTPVYGFPQVHELLLYSLFGLVCGCLSAFWVRLYYFVENLFNKGSRLPILARVVLGASLTALIGLPLYSLALSQGAGRSAYGVYGVGYEGIVLLLAGGIPVLLALILGLVKMAATSLTLGSGASGGLLVPSLYVGSMLGGAIGLSISQSAPGLISDPFTFASVGAAALFAGSYGSPIASIILLPEMSMSYSLLLPLMLSCSLSHVTARKLLHGSTINTLALELKGVRLSQLAGHMDSDLLSRIPVREAMTKKITRIYLSTPITKVSHLISSRESGAYPVVSGGDIVGIVDYRDVIRVPSSRIESTVAGDIMRPATTIDLDVTLADAIETMYKQNVNALVVIRAPRRRPVGLLIHEDIVRGYEAARHGHPILESNPLMRVKAREVMRNEAARLKSDELIKNIAAIVRSRPEVAYPVIDNGRLVGMVAYKNLVLVPTNKVKELRVKDVMDAKPITAYPEDTLDHVLGKMHGSKSEIIPIVEKKNKSRLLGIITLAEILKGYESE